MRAKDIKKVGIYLKRIAKDPFSKQNRTAMKRYLVEGITMIFEKARGLDFTMVYQCEENEHNNNYSKSPKKVLKKLFEDIDFSEKHGFLDMGCGKGYVMTRATAYPFEKIGGVEYTKELCDICQKNLNHLKLNQVEVFHDDAKNFDRYADYDIYYLNPYQTERQKAIVDAGFKLIRKIENENEQYFNINIYTNKEG